MPKIVIQEPALVLRRKSEKFEKTGTGEAKKLVAEMIETMKEKRGVGIAAPQINEGVQVIIVDTDDGPIALYNPKLLKTSKKKESGEEGCLSVAGVYGIVPRFTSVEVEAQNENGQIIRRLALFLSLLFKIKNTKRRKAPPTPGLIKIMIWRWKQILKF